VEVQQLTYEDEQCEDRQVDSRADAVIANFKAWLPMLASLPGAQFDRRDGVTCWTSDLPIPFFNGVFGPPTDIDAIDGILASFGQTPLLWLVPPPDNIDDELELRGLKVERIPGMAVELARLPSLTVPAGVEIRQVDDDPELLAVATRIAFIANGFPEAAVAAVLEMLARTDDRPQFSTFLATVNGTPAAASALWITDDVAGLYDVGTAPAFRRRGLGALVSLAAMSAGRQRGCRLGALESTPAAESVYRSLGFEEVCRITFATTPT
jgi:ribosomal protein S18 acetylase RimI-like enzyme